MGHGRASIEAGKNDLNETCNKDNGYDSFNEEWQGTLYGKHLSPPTTEGKTRGPRRGEGCAG